MSGVAGRENACLVPLRASLLGEERMKREPLPRERLDDSRISAFARIGPCRVERGDEVTKVDARASRQYTLQIRIRWRLCREFLVRGRKSLAAFGSTDVLSYSADGKSASASRPPFRLEIHFALPHRSLRTSHSSDRFAPLT
jgi:hypothetical protein